MPEPLPKPWPMDQLSTLAPCVPLLREVGLKFACDLIRGTDFMHRIKSAHANVEALIGT
jgi:hypothetical protein